MNEIRKRKLLEYLYPREEIAEFMFFDFYAELSLVLDKKICFSANNLKNDIRRKNLILAKEIVAKFLKENSCYSKKLGEYISTDNENIIINNVLYGYLLIISSNINRGAGADIFLDKRSICYSKTSIIDVL